MPRRVSRRNRPVRNRRDAYLDPSSPPEPSLQLALATLPAILAAVFAAASAATTSIPHARLQALVESLSGRQKAAVERYVLHGEHIESSWLIIRGMAIAFGAALLSEALVDQSGRMRIGLVTFGVLVAYGIPAEIGTVIARRTAEKSIAWFLILLRPFELVVSPIAWFITRLSGVVSGTVDPPREATPSLTETEVEYLVTEGEKTGSLAPDQSEMIRNVLDFSDVRVGDVMVPRTQVVAIEVTLGSADLLRVVEENEHSRYPVYEGRVDNVVGILHVKDLLTFAATSELKDLRIRDLMRTPVVFVPESQSASTVLKDMRSGRRHHMAVVIDEFGGINGVATLEDLIEEIIGDIRDEHDDDEAPIVDLGDGRLLVDASVAIGDLNRYLAIHLPENEDYHSLGGFLIERIGSVPQKGAVYSDEGVEFVIREADERHIVKVEVVRKQPSPESMPPPSSNQPIL